MTVKVLPSTGRMKLFTSRPSNCASETNLNGTLFVQRFNSNSRSQRESAHNELRDKYINLSVSICIGTCERVCVCGALIYIPLLIPK